MKILSIETSCDETAISIIEAKGALNKPSFKVLGNALYSQIALHAQYGGVFPNLAKREHAKNILPLTIQALTEAKLLKKKRSTLTKSTTKKITKTLEHEHGLVDTFIPFIEESAVPKIDAIAVTYGPGLEPALWVGIKFAEALKIAWGIPVIPINHMEGHIVSVLLKEKSDVRFAFPVLALLISGGHTELVISKKPLEYTVIGKTRDDAVGEAYDKVARMLGLPYPGGPEIANLARNSREKHLTHEWVFPRPMIHSHDFDFSFSGLKTAVLYFLKDKKITEQFKEEVSQEFEDAVSEVLTVKTQQAIEKYNPQSLVVAGGVIANTHIRTQFQNLINEIENIDLYFPTKELSTDNSVMIGIAAFLQCKKNPKLLTVKSKLIKANGNLQL